MEFPRVAPFNTRVRHLNKLEHYAYQCPRCKHESLFTLDDVKLSHGTKQSRIAPDVQQIFDASYPIRNLLEEFYFDFHCNGCSAPVRIYFEASEQRADCWEYFGSFIMELRGNGQRNNRVRVLSNEIRGSI